jgi:hypothetical protein
MDVGRNIWLCEQKNWLWEQNYMVVKNRNLWFMRTNLWLREQKPMVVGIKLFFREKNLLLGKQTISCGNKFMVKTIKM